MICAKDRSSVSKKSDWPGVFNMDPEGDEELGSCVATMVTPYHALTAAHCFDDGKWWPSFTVDIDGKKYTVSNVTMNKCFSHANDGPDGADLAIIKLSTKYSGKTYPVYIKGDEVGREFTLMGWGLAGLVN